MPRPTISVRGGGKAGEELQKAFDRILDYADEIARTAKANTIQPGVGTRYIAGPDGVIVEAEENEGSGTTVRHHAFQARVAGLTVTIRPGTARLVLPSNMNISVTVATNITDGYWFWVKAERTGDHFSSGVTCVIEHGATLPEPPAAMDGVPPAWGYHPLFYVTSNDTKIDFVGQIAYDVLWVKEDVAMDCTSVTYDLVWANTGTLDV